MALNPPQHPNFITFKLIKVFKRTLAQSCCYGKLKSFCHSWGKSRTITRCAHSHDTLFLRLIKISKMCVLLNCFCSIPTQNGGQKGGSPCNKNFSSDKYSGRFFFWLTMVFLRNLLIPPFSKRFFHWNQIYSSYFHNLKIISLAASILRWDPYIF